MKSSIFVSLVVFIRFFSCDAFKIQQRIVDGRKAGPGQFPYYMYLKLKKLNGEDSVCGASLINDEWLITAAHCLQNVRHANVHFEDYLLDRPKLGHILIVVQSNRFYIHPSYPPNDIGMCLTPSFVGNCTQIDTENLLSYH